MKHNIPTKITHILYGEGQIDEIVGDKIYARFGKTFGVFTYPSAFEEGLLLDEHGLKINIHSDSSDKLASKSASRRKREKDLKETEYNSVEEVQGGYNREVILDANRYIGYKTIYEAINAVTGTEYTVWRKACWPNAITDHAFRIWFPKLKEKKGGQEIPASFDCLNTISDDWNEVVFDDLRRRQTEDTQHYYGYDLIFAKEPGGGAYIFRGVFVRDTEKSYPNHGVSKRIGTKVRVIGKPADRIEILETI